MGNTYAREMMLKIAIMEDVLQVKILDLGKEYEQFVLNCYEGDEEAKRTLDTVIAVVGVKDLNIINSNNVILIANKDKMGELPNLIEKIKCDKKLKKYL